jgi:hypothetical protein
MEPRGGTKVALRPAYAAALSSSLAIE